MKTCYEHIRHKTDMDNSRSVQWKLRIMTYFIIFFPRFGWIIINIVIGLSNEYVLFEHNALIKFIHKYTQ